MKGWGGGKGAIVVVSHDKNFCSNIEFTHVVTVDNGAMKFEQRGAREDDWMIHSLSSSAASDQTDLPPTGQVGESEEHPMVDPSLRKKAYNAPKRIAKLEALIETTESQIEEIDAEMMLHGSDVGKLVDLTKSRDALALKVEDFMKEWEELESLLAMV